MAEAFGIDDGDVQQRMQAGAITSRCEQGMGADEGRWRLTFHYEGRALCLTVDAGGRILSRTRFDAPRRNPAS